MLKKALISICILLVVGLGVWKIFFGGETIKDKVENISESLTSYNIEGNMEIINGAIDNIKKIIIVASGSSYHCARFAVDLVEKISKIETRAISLARRLMQFSS